MMPTTTDVFERTLAAQRWLEGRQQERPSVVQVAEMRRVYRQHAGPNGDGSSCELCDRNHRCATRALTGNQLAAWGVDPDADGEQSDAGTDGGA
jgi:hypothetical protein